MYSTLLARMMPLFGFPAAVAAAACWLELVPGVAGLVARRDGGGNPGESGFGESPSSGALTWSRRHSGRREASSVMRSLMLSRRRRSTALCDSRRLRRFSVRSAALRESFETKSASHTTRTGKKAEGTDCFCPGSSGTLSSGTFFDLLPVTGALAGTAAGPFWTALGLHPLGSIGSSLGLAAVWAEAWEKEASGPAEANQGLPAPPGYAGIDMAMGWLAPDAAGAAEGMTIAPVPPVPVAPPAPPRDW